YSPLTIRNSRLFTAVFAVLTGRWRGRRLNRAVPQAENRLMARSRFTICLLTIAALFMAATPAFAQLGSIFRDEPPRPPPRSDRPPAQPLPAPMSLPPSSRPGGGSIQSQPLAPPPGVPVAPQPSGAAGPEIGRAHV